MEIELVTNKGKIFEGVFMGINNENIICILTNKHIISYKLDGIDNISQITRSLEKSFY